MTCLRGALGPHLEFMERLHTSLKPIKNNNLLLHELVMYKFVAQAKVILEDARKKQEAVDAEKARKKAQLEEQMERRRQIMEEKRRAQEEEEQDRQRRAQEHARRYVIPWLSRETHSPRRPLNAIIFWLHPCNTTND